MLKNTYILPTRFSIKSAAKYAKRILASNIALALIAMPSLQTSYINTGQSNLIIPEEKLDSSFHIEPEKVIDEPKIQIPIVFTYMSQGFFYYHPGIDLATKFGTPIKPVQAGVVEEAGFSLFSYGNEVLLDNGNGRETLYAHLSKIEVKKGDKVDMSTEIGWVGSSGHSSRQIIPFAVFCL